MAIILIGTAHLDIDGKERLGKVLYHLKPSVIGIEETRDDFEETSALVKSLSQPDNVEKAIKRARGQFPNANQDTLRLFLSSSNYENRVINEYAEENRIPLVYGDDASTLNKVDLGKEVRNPLSALNNEMASFLRLTPEQTRANIQDEYNQKSYPVVDDPNLVRFYSARDKFTADVLQRQEGNVVYVCGLDHIYGDYQPNLFDRLKDLRPIRMKLSKVDEL